MTRRVGLSLVEILVVLVLIALLTAAFTTGGFGLLRDGGAPRPDGKGETVVGRSMLSAKDGQCRSNLQQQRSAIQISTDPVEGTAPARLSDTRLGPDFERCPVGNVPYEYEPATGKVTCPHPGHEKH